MQKPRQIEEIWGFQKEKNFNGASAMEISVVEFLSPGLQNLRDFCLLKNECYFNRGIVLNI